MMIQYKIGDRVRFLNETGGGIVTRIDEQGMIFVETADGFEIPALKGDLIPAEDFSDDFHSRESSPVHKVPEKPSGAKMSEAKAELSDFTKIPEEVPENAEYSLLIGFIPETGGPVFSGNIECFLINDSGFCLYYMIGTFEQGRYYHLASGGIEANMKYYISSFTQTDISKISGMHVQAIWISEGKYNRKEPLDVLVDITMVNFSKEHQYRENEYFDSRALLFPVWSSKKAGKEVPGPQKDVIPLKADIKQAENKTATGKKQRNKDTVEVDLHIDQMVTNSSEHSPSEIIAMQIKRLHESMEEAISNKMQRIVIIHGVGQGTLKMQIRKELQEKYPEYLFQDASFKEYGFGATMVHLHTIRKQ